MNVKRNEVKDNESCIYYFIYEIFLYHIIYNILIFLIFFKKKVFLLDFTDSILNITHKKVIFYH